MFQFYSFKKVILTEKFERRKFRFYLPRVRNMAGKFFDAKESALVSIIWNVFIRRWRWARI